MVCVLYFLKGTGELSLLSALPQAISSTEATRRTVIGNPPIFDRSTIESLSTMAFAGVSLIADGELCASTVSPFDSGADSGYHLLVVEGYSHAKETTPNGECIRSRPFIVGGRHWAIDYHPSDYDSEDEEFISVFLLLVDDILQNVDVQYVFSFIDQPELRVSKHIRQSQPLCFYGCDYLDGQHRFMKREVFERSRHLMDDNFIFRCDIVVLESSENTEEQDTSTTAPTFIKLPPSDLQSHLSDLLLSKEGADITFEVGGKKFIAHRFLLAARSTVFKEQLFGATNVSAATSTVVKIDDIKAKAFQGLLTFIYTDGMPKSEIDDDADDDDETKDYLLQLLEAAERYDLQRLKSICEEKLANFICKGTVADIIFVAERRQCRMLKEDCLEFIKTHTNLHTVFTADVLEQIIKTCSLSVLKELVSKFAS